MVVSTEATPFTLEALLITAAIIHLDLDICKSISRSVIVRTFIYTTLRGTVSSYTGLLNIPTQQSRPVFSTSRLGKVGNAMSKANGKLRFAALIRVSTEKQKQQGESLLTQRSQLIDAVERLNGTIVEWYGGQEHATAGWEKKEVDRLIKDSQRKRFDAVIVAHADRWSRDNAKSMQGLEEFKAHDIGFYVGTTAYDLFNPEHEMFLGMSAVIGRFQARHHNKKSLENKIHRAKRNIPVSGSIPFGRIYDKKTGQWSIIPEVQKQMQDIAKRYLAGESLPALAIEHGIKPTTIYERLKLCGPKWPVHFKSEENRIDELVEYTIPAILDDKTIEAVRNKARANQTYTHGHAKHRYLLSRMVFCGVCGSAMSGQFATGKRYYRHCYGTANCLGTMIPADELEHIVMRHMFECFGNPKAIQRAVEEATPNREKIAELRQREERLLKELEKTKSGIDRVIGLVADDAISDEDARRKLGDLKKRQAEQQEELKRLEINLENVPSSGTIEGIANRISANFKASSGGRLILKKRQLNSTFDLMTWEDQRQLAETVFGGKTQDGKRMGVYVYTVPDQSRQWRFEALGHLVQELQGLFPISKERYDALFGPDVRMDADVPPIAKKATKRGGVTKPAPSGPIRRRGCCRRRRSRRRGGG